MASDRLLDALRVTTEVCGGREYSQAAARIMVSELRNYSEPNVLRALERCRREVRSLTLADIISRIDDGRPGPEEAWAMLPRDEAESVVWTREMRDAYSICQAQLETDPVAARMSFREAYVRMLSEARAAHMPATWEISLGHDASRRDQAISDAIRKHRITMADARAALPEFAERSELKLLPGFTEPNLPVVEKVRALLESITHRVPEEDPHEAEKRDQALIEKARLQARRIAKDDEGMAK